MRRASLLLATALPTLLGANLLSAQPASPRRLPGWASHVSVLRNDSLIGRETHPTQNMSVADWQSWITVEDMPADLQRRALTTASVVAVTVDETGAATGCRVVQQSSEQRLDSLACDLLRRRGRYSPRYAGPGHPVAAEWGMRIDWRTSAVDPPSPQSVPAIAAPFLAAIPSPPPPSSPPSRPDLGWPRLFWFEDLRLASLPDVQAAYPERPGNPRRGTVSLDLEISPARGIIGCTVGVGSGNALLDERACAVARRLELAYRIDCDIDCAAHPLPVQVVWDRQGSHIRFPLYGPFYDGPQPLRDPADQRSVSYYRAGTVLLPPDTSAPRPKPPRNMGFTNPLLELRYMIGADGRIASCEAQRSSGNSGLDRWGCGVIAATLRFSPRTDVFGDSVVETDTFRIDLSQEIGP